jgi:hypothetical protein
MPVELAGDRGQQSERVDLSGRKATRVTVAIGPGADGNFSYDWSYLADLRVEADEVARWP